ncbi:hypothetical protein F9222_26840, partial [Escherichia coli]
MLATTDTGTVVSGKNSVGDFSIENGQADKVLLENGGQLTVVSDTSATDTTIRDGGVLVVSSNGTAPSTSIEKGGTLNVEDGGKATGVTQADGAALIATTDKNTVVSGKNTRGEFS